MKNSCTPDKEIQTLIEKERKRQKETIDLIASENYVNQEVLDAMGSVLTNKYAEGYPGKRYYSGCAFVDEVEILAQERCKQLFGAEHANVQPHAGSQANMAVYFACLKPGDLIMGMSLAEGGHLTHGHSVNFSGSLYRSVQYTVDKETEQLDYNAIEKLAHEHKPKLIIAGASAYSRVIDFERFAAIAKNVGAFFLADIAHIAGLIAAQLHPTPVPCADFVSSTTHKTLRGPRGGLVMCKQEHAQSLDRAIMPGTQGGPFMNMIAAKAIAFHQAAQPSFKEYQKNIIENAQTMASLFLDRNYRIVAGGTDNHLFVLDLRNKNISGRAAELALEKAGITASRSCIPFDPAKPWITSGIRLGTPAITTRGITKEQIITLVGYIDSALHAHENEHTLAEIAHKIKQLTNNLA